MFCVTRVCVSIYIYIYHVFARSRRAVMTFYSWGKYTKKEGELVLSLCSLAKGAASFLTRLSKDEKERRKRKKRDQRGEKERPF